ncbi:MAG: efflux RND transporter permease subunit, partial [Candidatus Dadabacteria bacterium]
GVEHVYSVSRRDTSIVTVRFYVGEDREQSLIKLQSKISANIDKVPSGVAGWIVKPIDINDVPIVTLTLWSKEDDPFKARQIAEELASRLEELPNISRSSVVGGALRKVLVELDMEALQARGLSVLEVVKAIRASDASLASGYIVRDNKQIPVMAGPFIGSVNELKEIVLSGRGSKPVYVKDVAQVKDIGDEINEIVGFRLGPASKEYKKFGQEYHPAVTIALAKKKGTNAVSVAENILKRAEELKEKIVPSGYYLTVTRDYGETANEKVQELLRELSLAIITVVILIAFSLNWKAAFIVAAAVPITFALTLLINLLSGYTINRVTLFALVLSLGLVVDDPIVDVENVYRHYEAKKEPPFKALLTAVNEVRIPVIFATFAVIIAFLPMLFITGMMGPYMRPMALNVPVSMLMSLLVAFTVTPWMSYHLLKSEYGKKGHHKEEKSAGLYYEKLMAPLLRSYKRRKFFLGGIIFLFFFGLSLAVFRAVPLKMLPYDNKNELEIVLDMPEGTALEKTAQAAEAISRYLTTVNEVENVQTYIGTASPIDFNGLVRHYNLRKGAHQADIRINLVGKKKRAMQSHGIALRIRPEVERIAKKFGAKIAIVEIPPGPPVLSTVVAEVYGDEFSSYNELIKAGKKVEKELATLKGVVDIDDFSEDPHLIYKFILNKEKAALHGVSARQVVETVRAVIGGAKAGRVHIENSRSPIDIIVRLAQAEREVESLRRVGVKSVLGKIVPLGELGEFKKEVEDQPIYHKDLKRVVFVVAETAGISPAEVVLSLASKVKRKLGSKFFVNWRGEGEWKITVDVFRDLGIAFGVALIGIYILLVVQTHSLIMPVVIMLAIPLGIIGIFPGFWILNLLVGRVISGYEDPVWFTATGMIGMIALAGIAVRNSIILIDFINTALEKGVHLHAAVLEAGAKRIRPIVLTAGAAMLGAWPITLDPIFSGLAWSLIFGLIASTVFTLFVVPLVYCIVLEKSGTCPVKKLGE